MASASHAAPTERSHSGLPDEVVTCLQNARFVSLHLLCQICVLHNVQFSEPSNAQIVPVYILHLCGFSSFLPGRSHPHNLCGAYNHQNLHVDLFGSFILRHAQTMYRTFLS